MKRKIISIDREKCDGCGLCARACHEGAIVIDQGGAALARDSYCDGLGDCLPACHRGAISSIEREAEDYNGFGAPKDPFGSPRNFPIQLKLAPTASDSFRGRLNIAADCVGFLGEGRLEGPLLIGCPKLDGADYSEKLSEIFARNPIESVLIHKMGVPCCQGLVRMALEGAARSGKSLPLEVKTIEVRRKVERPLVPAES